jgi:exopolyphosphatase / guanosine-5'-triphosphate,3'-diphosphate pyrophosphatase
MISPLLASIDIGSNSTILCIGTVDGGSCEKKRLDIIYEEIHVTGLGRGLKESGLLSEVAMDETYAVLKRFRDLCFLSFEIKTIALKATEAMRKAKNAPSFLKKIKGELGLEIHIISFEKEAELTQMGVESDLDLSSYVLFDMGGASTEFALIEKRIRKDVISIPLGSVIATEIIAASEKIKIEKEAFNISKFKDFPLVAVAGTMTALAAMILGLKKFDEKIIHRREFSVKDFFELEVKIKSLKEEEVLIMFPFLGKRARTIKGGLYLAISCFEELDKNQKVMISTRGLRHGILLAHH